jgi:hypothetical protein
MLGTSVIASGVGGAGLGAVLVHVTRRRLGLPLSLAGRVEVAIAATLLSGIIGWRYDGATSIPAMLWLANLGVVLCVIDLSHRRLPDGLVLTLFVGGVVLIGAAAMQDGEGAVGLDRALVACRHARILCGRLATRSGGSGDIGCSRGWVASAIGRRSGSVPGRGDRRSGLCPSRVITRSFGVAEAVSLGVWRDLLECFWTVRLRCAGQSR